MLEWGLYNVFSRPVFPITYEIFVWSEVFFEIVWKFMRSFFIGKNLHFINMEFTPSFFVIRVI